MKLNNIQEFTIASIIVLALTCILFYVVPTSYFENTAINSKTTFFLAVIIGIFAVVEGFSTALQYYTSINESKKNEMRYTLEKIITPLYGLFELEEFPNIERDERTYVMLEGEDSKTFKEIILHYRYLLPDKEIGYMEEPNVGIVFLEPELVESFKTLYHEKLEEYFDFVRSH
jgi:hypothetical protein